MFVILSISDSDKHFSSAIQEYVKRLGKDIKIENLKPYKADNHSLVIEKETESIIDILKKKYSDYQKFLLIKEGELYDTLELAKVLKQKDSVFIIGWPYWVDEEKIKKEIPSIKEISFGAITLPHWLAKLTLVEQLYRVSTIWIWKKYHY